MAQQTVISNNLTEFDNICNKFLDNGWKRIYVIIFPKNDIRYSSTIHKEFIAIFEQPEE